MAKTKNQRARKNDSLTMEQVEDLAQTIISGKESETRAEALLILVDEMERCGLSGEPICWQVKQRAFAECGDETIDAHIQLIRSELPGKRKGAL